jgi:TPR repeat protein
MKNPYNLEILQPFEYYQKGIKLLEEENEEGIKYLITAGENYYLRAYHNMGIIYQTGLGDVLVDYDKAFNCFKKASEEENPDSFFSIGNCFLNGLGVDKNEKEAAGWFIKAAEMGEPDSMFHLAWMYQEGIGVEQNNELSTEYLYMSAEAGWEPAIRIIRGED